ALEPGFWTAPQVFEDPADTLMSPESHRLLADVIRRSRPKIDLPKHVEVTAGPGALEAAGGPPKQPAGSCELSLVDPQGNWVQMMNTLQSGGIPGEVVDGVPMVGSHGVTSLLAAIGGWFTSGSRVRFTVRHNLSVHCT